MNAVDPRIERFLTTIKQDQRSSPAGLQWHEFYEFLRSKRKESRTNPLAPLILAASGESDSSKYARLCAQLRWALENGCLEDAIRYLEAIPPDQWNRCPLDRWDRDSY